MISRQFCFCYYGSFSSFPWVDGLRISSTIFIFSFLISAVTRLSDYFVMVLTGSYFFYSSYFACFQLLFVARLRNWPVRLSLAYWLEWLIITARLSRYGCAFLSTFFMCENRITTKSSNIGAIRLFIWRRWHRRSLRSASYALNRFFINSTIISSIHCA